MDGVGAVHVVVTLESTGKKIVEKDVPTRSTTEENKKGEETGSVTSSSQDEATVYEKTQNGAETPYVVSEEYPAGFLLRWILRHTPLHLMRQLKSRSFSVDRKRE